MWLQPYLIIKKTLKILKIKPTFQQFTVTCTKRSRDSRWEDVTVPHLPSPLCFLHWQWGIWVGVSHWPKGGRHRLSSALGQRSVHESLRGHCVLLVKDPPAAQSLPAAHRLRSHKSSNTEMLTTVFHTNVILKLRTRLTQIKWFK